MFGSAVRAVPVGSARVGAALGGCGVGVGVGVGYDNVISCLEKPISDGRDQEGGFALSTDLR